MTGRKGLGFCYAQSTRTIIWGEGGRRVGPEKGYCADRYIGDLQPNEE